MSAFSGKTVIFLGILLLFHLIAFYKTISGHAAVRFTLLVNKYKSWHSTVSGRRSPSHGVETIRDGCPRAHVSREITPGANVYSSRETHAVQITPTRLKTFRSRSLVAVAVADGSCGWSMLMSRACMTPMVMRPWLQACNTSGWNHAIPGRRPKI